MAKDNRKILNAVRGAGNQLFKDGMEDELAAAASQERLDALKRDGVISGDWKSAIGAITVTGDAPSKEFANRAAGEGVRITGTTETAKFEPLSIEETAKRANNFDFSEEVTRSMTFHGEALKELLRNQLQSNASAPSGDAGNNNQQSDDEFPADFPARSKFIKLEKTYSQVKAMTREQLIELDNIAEKTADEVLAYIASSAK